MTDVDREQASRALEEAAGARAQGARRAARPGWYHPVLGVGLLVALASFSVDRPAVGVAVGLVLLPVAAELGARQQTGAAPLTGYTHPAVRGPVAGYAALVVVLAGAGVLLEEAAGLTGAAVVAGVLVLVATVVLGRRLDARRASGAMATDPA